MKSGFRGATSGDSASPVRVIDGREADDFRVDYLGS
jgi:hypothetical protein